MKKIIMAMTLLLLSLAAVASSLDKDAKVAISCDQLKATQDYKVIVPSGTKLVMKSWIDLSQMGYEWVSLEGIPSVYSKNQMMQVFHLGMISQNGTYTFHYKRPLETEVISTCVISAEVQVTETPTEE